PHDSSSLPQTTLLRCDSSVPHPQDGPQPPPTGDPSENSHLSWDFSSKSSLPHPNRPRPMSKQGEPWGFLVRKKFLNRACGGGPRPLCGLFAFIKRVLCLPFAKVPGLVKREAAFVRVVAWSRHGSPHVSQ